MPPLLVISGATGTGKSALAVDLALRFGGEVVNADSRAFYRGIDIGVSKPTEPERRGVPHHLIDILDPHDEMTLALFQERAMALVAEITGREGLPIVAGGTPLYLNALVEGWVMPKVEPNWALRADLEAEAAAVGVDVLADRLRAVDPTSAERAGTNLRRVIRALEVWEMTGVPMSAQEGRVPPPYRVLEIGLWRDRETLYPVLDARVDGWIGAGLVAEVRGLLAAGVDPACPAFSAIGYRQLIPYLRGESSLDDAVAQVKYDTHRYVRHQETWFRRNPRLVRIESGTPGWTKQVGTMVERWLGGADVIPGRLAP